MASLSPGMTARPVRQRTFHGTDEEDLVCWIGAWDSREDLDAFLQGDEFRGLEGAAEVLGELLQMEVRAACGSTTRSPPG